MISNNKLYKYRAKEAYKKRKNFSIFVSFSLDYEAFACIIRGVTRRDKRNGKREENKKWHALPR